MGIGHGSTSWVDGCGLAYEWQSIPSWRGEGSREIYWISTSCFQVDHGVPCEMGQFVTVLLALGHL